jgi:hypothetical protein
MKFVQKTIMLSVDANVGSELTSWPADIDAAAKAVAALSRFIAKAHATYDSIDINPLTVREQGKGAVAVDALLVPRKNKPN